MSWSLQIRNGDFTSGGAQLGTVSSHEKLVQDLSHWLLEPMGTDNLHAGYGSLIDGGVENGIERESMIGLAINDSTLLRIRAEISRIIEEYRSLQLTRAKQDKFALKNATLTKGEILYEVNGVSVSPQEDTVTVSISITTGTDQMIDITVPVSTAN